MPIAPRRALVRPPAPCYARCLREDTSRAIDVEAALAEHRGYVEALRRAGLEVVELPAEPELPDACFLEDTAVIRGEIAVITRPGAPSRRPETESVASALAPLMEVRRMGRGRLDGGDVMLMGDVAYVGLTARTDAEGAEELGRLLEVEARAAPVRGLLHLKSAATPLGPDRILLLAGALERFPFEGMTVIHTDEPLGANVLAIRERALVSAGAPRTAVRLRELGFAVERIALDEFHAGDAGLTCLSLVF